MKLKSVVAAVATLVAVASAHAGSLGALPVPSSTGFGANATTGTLDETWSFSTAVSSYANATATSTVTIAGNITLFGLDNFSAWLDGQALTLTLSAFGNPNTFFQGTQTLAMTPILLSAGAHELKIKGTITGQYGGGYSGTLALAAAPVPEPETYAMMLAGLAAVGFLARRRQA